MKRNYIDNKNRRKIIKKKRIIILFIAVLLFAIVGFVIMDQKFFVKGQAVQAASNSAQTNGKDTKQNNQDTQKMNGLMSSYSIYILYME